MQFLSRAKERLRLMDGLGRPRVALLAHSLYDGPKVRHEQSEYVDTAATLKVAASNSWRFARRICDLAPRLTAS